MKTYSNIFNYIPETMVCAAIINLTYEIIPVDENVFQVNFHHQASEIVAPGAHIKIYGRKHGDSPMWALIYDTGPFYTGNQTIQMDMNFKYDFRLQITNNGECPEIPIDDCPGFDNIGMLAMCPIITGLNYTVTDNGDGTQSFDFSWNALDQINVVLMIFYSSVGWTGTDPEYNYGGTNVGNPLHLTVPLGLFNFKFVTSSVNSSCTPDISNSPNFLNIGISDLLPTQSFWYQGIWIAGDTVHDPEVNCYVDYIDENGAVQHFIIGPEENGCQEIMASSILDTFGVTTCNPNPTTVMLCQRNNTGTTAGNVCSVMINTNCKVEMQNVSFIQTGDRVLNSNSTPFNGLNKYWLIRQSIASIDDPAYPCLVDNNGYVTVSFLCS